MFARMLAPVIRPWWKWLMTSARPAWENLVCSPNRSVSKTQHAKRGISYGNVYGWIERRADCRYQRNSVDRRSARAADHLYGDHPAHATRARCVGAPASTAQSETSGYRPYGR